MAKLLVLLVFLLCVVAVCYCDGGGGINHNGIKYVPFKKKKKKHFKHHLIYAAITYLTFLLIKFKIVFFFGTIFAVICAGAKIWAFTRYLERNKHEVVYDHGPEKVYLSSPGGFGGGFGGGYGGGFGGGYGGSFGDGHGFGTEGVTLDHPPTGAGGGYEKSDYLPPKYGKARSTEDNDDIMANILKFGKMLRSMNLTDLTFDDMKMTELDCKRRFVCESDFNASQIPMLKKGYDMLNDDNYNEYRTNKTITSVEECEEMYPNCQNYEQLTSH